MPNTGSENSSQTPTLVNTLSLSLRPPVYKMGDDLGQFLTVYQRIADANQWSEEQRKNFLIVSFPNGSIHQSICIMADPGKTFSQLIDELKRMVSAHEPRLKLAQYETRVMRDGETVGEYEKSLRLLYHAAIGQASDPDSDPRYVTKFIDGLPNRWRTLVSAEMRDSVLGDNGALSHAQRLEASEKLHVPTEPLGTSQFFPISAAQAQSASGAGGSVFSPDISQLQMKLDALTVLVQDLINRPSRRDRFDPRRRSDSRSSSEEERRARDRSHAVRRRQSTSRSRATCGYCKKPGHTLEACWALQRKNCQKCGKSGHTTTFCQRRDSSCGRPKPRQATRNQEN